MATGEEEDNPVVLLQRIAEYHQKLAFAWTKEKQGGSASEPKGGPERPAEVAPKGNAGQPEQGKGERAHDAPRA
eukprot:6854655-Heterocapsa_arctica.AAC.1